MKNTIHAVKTRSRYPYLIVCPRLTLRRQNDRLTQLFEGKAEEYGSKRLKTHPSCTSLYNLPSPTEGHNGESKE